MVANAMKLISSGLIGLLWFTHLSQPQTKIIFGLMTTKLVVSQIPGLYKTAVCHLQYGDLSHILNHHVASSNSRSMLLIKNSCGQIDQAGHNQSRNNLFQSQTSKPLSKVSINLILQPFFAIQKSILVKQRLKSKIPVVKNLEKHLWNNWLKSQVHCRRNRRAMMQYVVKIHFLPILHLCSSASLDGSWSTQRPNLVS